jgi:tryptophan synthase beta subunit
MVARFQVLFLIWAIERKVVKARLCSTCGGGSLAAGTYYHFLDNEDLNIIAVEAAG